MLTDFLKYLCTFFLGIFQNVLIITENGREFIGSNALFAPPLPNYFSFNQFSSPALSGNIFIPPKENIHGCLPPTEPLLNNSIPLLLRGSCPFSEKVKNFQLDGVPLILIGNNQSTKEVVFMLSFDDELEPIVPAVFVSGFDYENLVDLVLDDKSKLSVRKKNSVFQFVSLSTIVHVILWIAILRLRGFSVMSFMLRFFKLIGRRKSRGRIRVRRIDDDNILDSSSDISSCDEEYPINLMNRTRTAKKHRKKYIKKHIGATDYQVPQEQEKRNSYSTSTSCCICLDDFVPDEKIRKLNTCRHQFHVYCIDSWLVNNPFCPFCKTSVFKDSEKALPEKTNNLVVEEYVGLLDGLRSIWEAFQNLMGN